MGAQPQIPTRGQRCQVALVSMFDDPQTMRTAPSPVYGERDVQIRLRSLDLLWRPVGAKARFVAVLHPTRGRCLLMGTDLSLDALEIVRLYGHRFQIEMTFKHALHVVGAFAYHFWMAAMKPRRRGSGDLYPHRENDAWRAALRRKLSAYHRFMQLGLIAQGLMIALATTVPEKVWLFFDSWLRTARAGVRPSERVVATALRNTLPDFLEDAATAPILKKFLTERQSKKKSPPNQMAA